MSAPMSKYARLSILTAVLAASNLVVPTSQADVTGSSSLVSGFTYELRAVANPPCDEAEWTLLAGPPDVILTEADTPTATAQVGFGIFVFQFRCSRDGEEDEFTTVALDTRPPSIVITDFAPIEFFALPPFEPPGPWCLSCPNWLDDFELTLTDPLVFGQPSLEWELDPASFEDVLSSYPVDPQVPAIVPEQLQLEFATVDLGFEWAQGDPHPQPSIVEQTTLIGFDADHDVMLTVGALSINPEGSLGAAGVLISAGDPNPQPS